MIATLTMSPALDLFCSTDRMHTDSKSRCHIQSREAGGGGINVARNLKRMGAEVQAVFPAGGYHGRMLVDLLEKGELSVQVIETNAETTQNLALTDKQSGCQYHLVFPGAELDASECDRCLERIRQLRPVPSLLVMSGSFPPGVPATFAARLVNMAKAQDIRVVLDTSGEALGQALSAGVYLSKLNREDFTALGYRGSDDYQERLAAMSAMVARGDAELLVLTLGEDGALLATRDGPGLHVRPNPVEVVSHVGAGDAFVSMMTWQLYQGLPPREAFSYGVAAAAAAISTEGNQLTDPALVERIVRDGLTITAYNDFVV